MPSLLQTHSLSLVLRTLSIVSAVLNTLLLLTYYQDTGNWECQTEPANVLLSVHIEDFSSLLECLWLSQCTLYLLPSDAFGLA